MDDTLRYLPADRVEHRYGCLGFTAVRDETDRVIGRLEGVLVSPVERKLKFLVVKTRGLFGATHRLIPADWPAHLDRTAGALRIDGENDLAHCPRVEPASLTPLRDEDVLEALFGRVA